MNIKEHIDAGHYGTPENGGQQMMVPMRDGRVAIIYTTEHQSSMASIVGGVPSTYNPEIHIVMSWQETGRWTGAHAGEPSPNDLLPPPPRISRKTYWLVYPVDRRTGAHVDSISYGSFSNHQDALAYQRRNNEADSSRVYLIHEITLERELSDHSPEIPVATTDYVEDR